MNSTMLFRSIFVFIQNNAPPFVSDILRPYCNYLRFSNKRHELLSKLYRKMDKLRQRKHSQFMISTVQPNLNFGHDYHHRRYADL